MDTYLVDDNSKQEKAKELNKIVVATISDNEYKDDLLNKNCLRDLKNRIQIKDHRAGTHEINKFFFFDDKRYIQSNGLDGSTLCYYS